MDSQNRHHLHHDGNEFEPSEPPRKVGALAPETTQPGAPRKGRTVANPLLAGKSLQVRQRTGGQAVMDLPGCPRHARPILLQVGVNRKSAPRTHTAECAAVIARAATAPHPTTSSCNHTSAADASPRRPAREVASPSPFFTEGFFDSSTPKAIHLSPATLASAAFST